MSSGRPNPPALAAEFPPADPARWRQLAAAVLRGAAPGADPVEALSSRTYDGVPIRPLYTAADAIHQSAPGRPPFVRGATADGATAAGWDVRTWVADPDPARAGAAARTDLELGATSLWLPLGGTGPAIAELASVLEDFELERVPVVLDAGPDAAAAADALLRIARERGLPDVAGSLGADPIGARARTGRPAELGVVAALAERAAPFPRLIPVTVDATVYHNAAAGDADEVAIATAVGVA